MSTSLYLAYAAGQTNGAYVLDVQGRKHINTGRALISGSAARVAYKPDGSQLAISQSSPTNMVEIVDTTTWASVFTINPAFAPFEIAWSPDGTKLALGCTSRLIVYRVSDWFALTNQALTGSVLDLAWSPDGTMLALARSSSPYLSVFETAGWTAIGGLPAQTDSVQSVAFAPDGTKLALSPTGSQRLTMLNVSDWSAIAMPAVTASVSRIRWAPDGAHLAIGGASLRVLRSSDWSLQSGVVTLPGTSNRLNYAADGRLAVTHLDWPYVTIVSQNGTAKLDELVGIPLQLPELVWSPGVVGGTISGTITDELGSPAAGRAMALVHDATKAIIGTAVTNGSGAYSFFTPYSGAGHTVLLYEDDGRVQALGGGVLPV